MRYVRMLVQECKPGTVEALTRKVEQTLVQEIRQIPGFVSYQIVKVDDRVVLAVGTFDSREAAEELERVGAAWRKKHGKDDIVSTKLFIGEILLEERAQPPEAHPVM